MTNTYEMRTDMKNAPEGVPVIVYESGVFGVAKRSQEHSGDDIMLFIDKDEHLWEPSQWAELPKLKVTNES